MSRGEWVFAGLIVFFGLIIVGCVIAWALMREERGIDWSDWGREHNDR